jgi:hypothetical protein
VRFPGEKDGNISLARSLFNENFKASALGQTVQQQDKNAEERNCRLETLFFSYPAIFFAIHESKFARYSA